MSDITALLAQLQSRNPLIRQQAAEQLGDLRATNAVEPLLERLTDRIDRVQVAAATALGQIGDARAVKPLIRSFHGNTYGLTDGEGTPGQYFMIVESAAQSLGRIGTTAAVDALLVRLAADAPLEEHGTAAAAEGLGFVNDSRVLPALLKALNSPSFFVRDHVTRALGRVGDTRAVEPLMRALHDTAWSVQVSAAEALGTIGDVRAAARLQAVFEHVDTYVPEKAVDAFLLRYVRILLRAKAARGMALIGTLHSLQFLERMLHATTRETQTVAAIGFAYRKDPRIFHLLIEALKNKELAIQIEAIEALGYLGDVRAEPFLEAVVRDQRVRARVIDKAEQTLKRMRELRGSNTEEL